ncbi:MAG: hypothetical protein IJS96_05195 [Schwartzia sp.]|nr:hypothetical protein [Schwartzia sp. (in: firmicutes)]
MKTKKTIFTAALAAALAAVSPSFSPVPVLGSAVCEAMVPYENEGMTLVVPGYYDELLYTKVFKDDAQGRLFSVTEAKSVVDSWIQKQRDDGPGWLFTIGRVNEARLHELLCGDMSGADVFARDKDGRYYIFYHPTDVRFVRQDTETMHRDQKIWSDLNEWAHTDVRVGFIENNQLNGIRYDNSSVSMYLARAAYERGVNYTVSTNQYGPLSPSSEVEAAYFVERLIQNATYNMVDKELTPDGQYVVLNFPDEKIRFDFFNLGDNYVREVHDDGYEILYQIRFDDGVTKASKVMNKWYDALAAAR